MDLRVLDLSFSALSLGRKYGVLDLMEMGRFEAQKSSFEAREAKVR